MRLSCAFNAVSGSLMGPVPLLANANGKDFQAFRIEIKTGTLFGLRRPVHIKTARQTIAACG